MLDVSAIKMDDPLIQLAELFNPFLTV